MKKIILLFIPVILAACNGYKDVICTQEFRMIMVKVENSTKTAVSLDSSYTIRQSTNQKIRHDQQMGQGYYVVLDDMYHSQLKNKEDNFRFVGWKGNQVVVDETYRIGADNCHIYKRSGADSVVVQ